MVRFWLYMSLFAALVAPVQAQNPAPHPASLALKAEEMLLQHLYEDRISTFLTLNTNSTKFQVTVEVKLGIFLNEADPDSIPSEEPVLPGFELPSGGQIFTKLINMFKKDQQIPASDSNRKILWDVARQPIDIDRLKVTILLDETLATDNLIDTIQQNLHEIIPYVLARDGDPVIKSVKFPRASENIIIEQPQNLSKFTLNLVYGLAIGLALIFIILIILLIRVSQLPRQLLVKSPSPEPIPEVSAPPQFANKEQIATEAEIDFSFLTELDLDKQYRVVKDESPRIIALILAHLSPVAAGKILTQMPTELREQVTRKLLELQGTTKDVLKEVQTGLRKKVQIYHNATYIPSGGVDTLAAIISWVPETQARETVNMIKAHDHDRALELSQKILTFEKLINLNDEITRELCQQIDVEILAKAVEGASTELRDKFHSSLSPGKIHEFERMAEFSKRQSTREVEIMRHEVMTLAKELLLKHNVQLNQK